MHLKSLEISGFKSFARKTTLNFNQGITAIVGPNGSGKSNIADAVRWVMGEQSIKTLRGKKSEDVIFSGSDKKTKLGLAEVSLELDNTDKQVPIDYADLLITRKIYRNGDSDYLINNTKSRLSDINILLTQANFGHRTYSVIGQGMIDNFLISTPQERKEFFEEATGVKQYQIKKQQSLNKLESVWQNLTTLKIKISEMEPQLRLLTRQVKRLAKRKEVEAKLYEEKILYYTSYWHEINSLYLTQQKTIGDLKEVKDKIDLTYQNLEKKLNQLTKNNTSSEYRTNLRQQENKLTNQKIQFKEELLTLRVTQTNQISNDVQHLKKISTQQLKEINQQVEQINLLHQKIIKLIDNADDSELIKQEIVNINKKNSAILELIKPYIAENKPSKKELADNPKVKQLEKQLEDLNQQINKIQQDIIESEQKDNQDRSDLWRLQNEFTSSQRKLNDINTQLNNSRIDLARTETRRFDLKKEINTELNDFDNLNKNNPKKLSDQEKSYLINNINKLKNQLEVIGGIDLEIEAEYETTHQRYNFLNGQQEDLSQTSESLRKLIDELDEIIKKQVKKSYDEINKYFQKYFIMLFEGGHAELTLVKEKASLKKDITDEESELIPEPSKATNFFQPHTSSTAYSGIDVSATPPGKRLKSINALSGGERALTSIALICAIISSNPSPFVILDEVDAALDESNSIRFAKILSDLSHKTQFIVVTHNRATMEQANLLYGVTMGNDGISKLLSIKLDEAKKYNS